MEAAAGAPTASRQQPAPALGDRGAQDTPALQQPCDEAPQSSIEGPDKNAVLASSLPKEGRKSARSSTTQQENSAAELGQAASRPYGWTAATDSHVRRSDESERQQKGWPEDHKEKARDRLSSCTWQSESVDCSHDRGCRQLCKPPQAAW